MPIDPFLKELLNKPSVSGDESEVMAFLARNIDNRKIKWKTIPVIFHGEEFHDCILLQFGSPRTAVFAHVDTIGFMVRYANQLIPVGGPELIQGTRLVGKDSYGEISCKLVVEGDALYHDFPRQIDRGTRLSFAQDIRLDAEFIQGAYLDNRLGVYAAMQLCETIEDAEEVDYWELDKNN